MKKLFLLVAFIATVCVSQAQGQQGGDPEAALARYTERVKPQLIEKAKLTEAEAKKVIYITFENRAKMRNFRELSADERKTKMTELQTEQNKQFAAIGITEEKIKAINEVFEEQRKQMQQRQQNGGGGGGNK